MFRRMQVVVFGLSVAIGASCFLYGQSAIQQGEQKAEPKEVPKISATKPISFWMNTKLNTSKSVFEALVKGDFEKLESDAEQMRLIGKLEGFVRGKNPDYKAQLHSFELANQELIRQSKRRNVEGTALAFNQLTSSCVACHAMLRAGIE